MILQEKIVNQSQSLSMAGHSQLRQYYGIFVVINSLKLLEKKPPSPHSQYPKIEIREPQAFVIQAKPFYFFHLGFFSNVT